MTAAIEISGLNKTYPGGHRALTDFSLTVSQGEIFGFLGPNGAGKTTTIKILLGLLSPSSGIVSILGEDPTKPTTRTRVGYLPEVANYYEFMNVRELLKFYGRISGMDDDAIHKRSEELLDLVGLDPDARKRMLGKFSKGMLQRAGIAQALLHDPDVLILDEPMTGLDPLARLQMRDVITCLRDAGKTVFFSSHELSETEVVCNRFGILNKGRLCWCGQASDMVGDGKANLERIFLKIIQDDNREDSRNE
jgi:ABC-2 type transport system ATP-binding protein